MPGHWTASWILSANHAPRPGQSTNIHGLFGHAIHFMVQACPASRFTDAGFANEFRYFESDPFNAYSSVRK